MRHERTMQELIEHLATAADTVLPTGGSTVGSGVESRHWAEDVLAEAQETLEAIDQIQHEDEPLARRGFQPMLSHLELTAITSLDLAMLMAEAGRADAALVWSEEYDGSPRPTIVTGILLTHITNAQLAIRVLTLRGFDTQARIQLRSLIEFADIAVVACADAKFMTAYLEAQDTFEGSRSHWQKNLRPALIRARLDELLPREIGPELAEWRQSTYTWMTQFAHAGLVAQAVSTWTPPVGQADPLHYSLGGQVTELSRITLAHTACYVAFAIAQVAVFVARSTNLSSHTPFSDRFEELRKRTLVITALCDLLHDRLMLNAIDTSESDADAAPS